jgi:hypothetical protein
MQQLKEEEVAASRLFPATVAALIDAGRVVINRGAQDGIRFGQRFTIYELSEQDIVDPATNESLGHLEIIRGTGSVVHIQDRMSIVEARPKDAIADLFSPRNQVFTFKGAKVGDLADPSNALSDTKRS